MAQRAAQLRALLQRDGTLMVPGAFSAMTARLAERAGFSAVYVPGGGTALNGFGWADVGLLTLNEMVANAAAIAQAVSVPVIADADTGFGNQLNVQRCVREYERAGVAAIHIEDQEFPKKCGFFEGKRLIPLEEAAQKIRAACAARSDPDFMIIARCDALSAGGMEEAVARATAYSAAGADMIFVEGGGSEEDLRNIPRRIPGPHLFNMSASGKVPVLTASELAEMGYKMMIFPNFATLAALRATREVYARLAKDQSIAGLGDLCADFADFTDLGGLKALRAIEAEFSGAKAS